MEGRVGSRSVPTVAAVRCDTKGKHGWRATTDAGGRAAECSPSRLPMTPTKGAGRIRSAIRAIFRRREPRRSARRARLVWLLPERRGTPRCSRGTNRHVLRGRSMRDLGAPHGLRHRSHLGDLTRVAVEGRSSKRKDRPRPDGREPAFPALPPGSDQPPSCAVIPRKGIGPVTTDCTGQIRPPQF